MRSRLCMVFLVAVCCGLLVSDGFSQPPERGFGGRRRGGGPGAPGEFGPGGPGGAAELMKIMPVISALDADSDGEISSDEIENAVAALKKLDKNGDGKLTRDEIRPDFGRGRGGPEGRRRRGPGEGGGGPEQFVERIMAHDTNEDGNLSKDELPERMQRLLTRADENGDEVLSTEELAKLAEQFGRRGGRDRGPRRPERPERPEPEQPEPESL